MEIIDRLKVTIYNFYKFMFQSILAFLLKIQWINDYVFLKSS